MRCPACGGPAIVVNGNELVCWNFPNGPCKYRGIIELNSEEKAKAFADLQHLCECAFKLYSWSVSWRDSRSKGLSHQYTSQELALLNEAFELSGEIWRMWRQVSHTSLRLQEELDL